MLMRACPGLPADEPADFKSASFDTLLLHAQRDGTTPAKRENRKLAREEIFARGGQSLDYFVGHAHIRNLWVHILIEQLVNRLEKQEAVPVLLPYLESKHERTRKTAAFYLGFFDAPEHAARVLPLLHDEETAGAAARTLGKWRVEEAVPQVLRILKDEKERRRVIAANALGEIGDASAVPSLIEALGDPIFTVRKCAARALLAIGEPARSPLEAAAPSAGATARREIESVLAALDSRKTQDP